MYQKKNKAKEEEEKKEEGEVEICPVPELKIIQPYLNQVRHQKPSPPPPAPIVKNPTPTTTTVSNSSSIRAVLVNPGVDQQVANILELPIYNRHLNFTGPNIRKAKSD